MGWGIECARDGVKLLEHIKRFLEGGNYYPWITSGQMTDYILIDFRQTLPRTPQPYPWLYYVIYSNNYASYEVLNYQLEKVVGPISLINHG